MANASMIAVGKAKKKPSMPPPEMPGAMKAKPEMPMAPKKPMPSEAYETTEQEASESELHEIAEKYGLTEDEGRAFISEWFQSVLGKSEATMDAATHAKYDGEDVA